MKPNSDNFELSWGKMISILFTLVALIAIAAELIMYRPYLGKGFTYFIVLFMLIFIFIGFKKPIRMKFDKWREERRLSNLAEQQFPVFKELLERFKEFTAPNRSDNIPYIAEEFSGVRMFSISEINDFLSIYEECMKDIDKPWKKLFLSIKCFEWILSIYNEYCICKPIKAIGELDVEYDQKKEKYRKNYGKYKRKYLSFIDDYVKFAKKMNSEYSIGRFGEYFEEPEDF
jgi:hypothetical protein